MRILQQQKQQRQFLRLISTSFISLAPFHSFFNQVDLSDYRLRRCRNPSLFCLRRFVELLNMGFDVPMKGLIVGLVYPDGVILGADTDKNCEKIHFMAPNIYCCGAGTAADIDTVSSQLKLDRYHTGRESRVVTALSLLKSHIFNYQGHVSAGLVLGGVDVTGPHLHTISPHGSTDTVPYATMGSGSLAAMAIFDSKYHEGLTKEEGIELVAEAIRSGIFNDLGSGSNVDVCVITKVNTEYLRNYDKPTPRTYVNEKGYTFSKKTEVLMTKVKPLKELVEAVEVSGDAMDRAVNEPIRR